MGIFFKKSPPSGGVFFLCLSSNSFSCRPSFSEIEENLSQIMEDGIMIEWKALSGTGHPQLEESRPIEEVPSKDLYFSH